MDQRQIGNRDQRDRLVHVCFGLEIIGGEEKLLLELARHTDQSRFAPTFVCLGHRTAFADELESHGGVVEFLDEPSGVRPSLVVRLARRFRRWRPLVVHTHDDRSLIYGAPAARLARVPRVIHTRHGREIDASGRRLVVLEAVSHLVDHCVCVSDDLKRLSVFERIAPGRLLTVRNGIDLERFAFAGPCSDGLVVAVSRLRPEKDLANLIRAAAIARKEDAGLRVEIAGDGPCLSELQQLVEELGLSKCVYFLGDVRDVSGLLARSQMMVLPSRAEGISLTLLEAMARGLPVVATRVGGTPEVVIDGETGLLVPASDPAALAEAIVKLRHDHRTCSRMGEAGRQRVERLFDVRRMVAEYEALYVRARLDGTDAECFMNARTAAVKP